jgi:hypothetical protein
MRSTPEAVNGRELATGILAVSCFTIGDASSLAGTLLDFTVISS